ncbi:MAG: polysaccharide deacetylase family protein [Dermabacter sp.]|nr:polysaccharide deacetylase family protein [Dermabacter sp.]
MASTPSRRRTTVTAFVIIALVAATALLGIRLTTGKWWPAPDTPQEALAAAIQDSPQSLLAPALAELATVGPTSSTAGSGASAADSGTASPSASASSTATAGASPSSSPSATASSDPSASAQPTSPAPSASADSSPAAEPSSAPKPTGDVILVDLNGDGREDAAQLLALTSSGGTQWMVAAALARDGQEPVIVPAALVGANLTNLTLAAPAGADSGAAGASDAGGTDAGGTDASASAEASPAGSSTTPGDGAASPTHDSAPSADSAATPGASGETSAPVLTARGTALTTRADPTTFTAQLRLTGASGSEPRFAVALDLDPAADEAPAAGDASATPAKAGEASIDAGSLTVTDAKTTKATKDAKDAPSVTVDRTLEFGQPADLHVTVPDTHTLRLEGMSDDVRVLATDSDGKDHPVNAQGIVPGSGELTIRASTQRTVTAPLALTATLTPKPAPEAEKAPAQSAPTHPTHTADGRPIMYFTFDDGPADATPQILAILARNNAKGTFFMLGNAGASHGDLVTRVRGEGHAVGNHSYSHPSFTHRTNEQIQHELSSTAAVIGATTCTRPPYGATDGRVRGVLRDAGQTQELWTIDTLDWKKPGADAIVNEILNHAAPGAVVLMHDGGGDRSQSIAALERVLPDLAQRGYVFQALPEC